MLVEVDDELVAVATGAVRDRSFSLKFKNFKFGVHCKIL